jgi:alpha-D-xyloside xylohydrolase
MAETLRGGISLGLCGFGFWSHDIGGFEGTPNAALFKRWLAFGLLSSHSRLHGSTSYRVPWSIDDESAEVCRFFTELKTRLLPYILQAAQEAHKKGVPVLRAMFLEFPDDPACAYLDRQYMIGPDLLVAPVFSEDGEVSYYLPAGEWKQYLTNETAQGGRWITEKHDFMSLPMWVRAGAQL